MFDSQARGHINSTSGQTSVQCKMMSEDDNLNTESQASLGNLHHPTSFV
jgi:hypothetical protein